MKVVIRADASVDIGAGHVMRCLTLAEELRGRGAKVVFVCRDLPGNMADVIREKNFQVFLLPFVQSNNSDKDKELSLYEKWLGVSWVQDAEEMHLMSDATGW